mmetsp:Transcript_73308/g.210539  ORF Transcript_73308/g.210539 Transcript_73308/m.210539 type:complete len:242 (+) Transcript_73308:3-728(+)
MLRWHTCAYGLSIRKGKDAVGPLPQVTVHKSHLWGLVGAQLLLLCLSASFWSPSLHFFVSLLVPLDTAVRRHLVVENISEDESRPRCTLWQVVVEFGCDFPNLGQVRPRDVRKVMVLVVVADVVREHVQRPVVRVRLCHAIDDVVLGKKVAGRRVDGAGEKGAQEEVEQALWAEGCRHRPIERQLHCPIQGQPATDRHNLRLRQTRSERVGEDLPEHEDSLAKAVVDLAKGGASDHRAFPT